MKRHLKVKKYIPIFFIVLISLFLRLFYLSKVPISVFGDEIDVGVQAYSILKTQKDVFSNSFPVIFHSFSEYRLPVQIYSAAATIGIWGLNEIGVRMASVLFSVASIIAIYLLSKKLFGYKLAVIVSLFLAISPWHIHFSRQANDSGFLLSFVIFGTYFFIKALENYKFVFLSSIIFSLSFYSYATSSVFTPLLIFSLLAVFRDRIKDIGYKNLLLSGLLFLLILIPFARESYFGSTTNRFNYVSVFNDRQVEEEYFKKLQISNSFLTEKFYSKKAIIAERILSNYLTAFSTRFLFVDGDANLRHSVGVMGQMYYFDIILLIFGVFALIKLAKKNKACRLVLFWLFISPIPSSLTSDGATHAGRLLIMLPALIILSALGFERIIDTFKVGYKKAVPLILILMMIVNISFYFHKYLVIWPSESWRFWHYGFKEALTFTKEIDQDYDRVFFNNTYEPMLPRFLFWYEYDPIKFQEQFDDDKHIKEITPGFDGFKLSDKYYFGQPQKPVESFVKKNELLVASARDDITNPSILNKSEFNLLKTTYSPSGIPIFYIISGN